MSYLKTAADLHISENPILFRKIHEAELQKENMRIFLECGELLVSSNPEFKVPPPLPETGASPARRPFYRAIGSKHEIKDFQDSIFKTWKVRISVLVIVSLLLILKAFNVI